MLTSPSANDNVGEIKPLTSLDISGNVNNNLIKITPLTSHEKAEIITQTYRAFMKPTDKDFGFSAAPIMHELQEIVKDIEFGKPES